jgi:hypothetical protein
MAIDERTKVTPFILEQQHFHNIAYNTLVDAINMIPNPYTGQIIYIISENRFYYYDKSSWVAMQVTASSISNLENKTFNVQYFEIIDSGTSGTLTPPQGGSWGDINSIALNQFGGGIDIFVSQTQDGYPTGESVPDSSSSDPTEVCAATLDLDGNWSLVGIPSTWPIALVYYYTVKLIHFDSSLAIGGLNGISQAGSNNEIYELQQLQTLDTNLIITASKNSNTTHSYLKGAGGSFMNQSPFVLPYDATITHISASTSSPATWQAEIHYNGMLIPGAFLNISTASTGFKHCVINVNAGTKIMLYCNGVDVPNPRIDCVFKRRKL